MQSSDWCTLLSCIPVDKHDCLCLLTTGGLHINLQSIIRKEQDFLVVRGRIGGSTDAGYTFLLPYTQLECVYIQRPTSEAEIMTWFPQGALAAAVAAVPRPLGDGVAPAPLPPALAPAPAAPAPAVPGLATASIQTKSGQIPLPGKAAILERLRKRTGNSAPGTMPKPPLAGPGPGATPNPPEPPAK
jgi:hypothetical protein